MELIPIKGVVKSVQPLVKPADLMQNSTILLSTAVPLTSQRQTKTGRNCSGGDLADDLSMRSRRLSQITMGILMTKPILTVCRPG